MRLSILCDSQAWGGLEMNVYRLAMRLNERGNEVILFSNKSSRIFREASQKGIRQKSITIKSRYFDIKAAWLLAKELKKEQLKILIINTSPNIYLAVLTKILLRIFFLKDLKIIYLQHMELGVSKKGIVQTFLYKHLSAWVSPLNLLAKQVCEKTYLAKKKIHIIPFGIDIGEFVQSEKFKSNARECLKLDPQKVYIGTIGRLDPLKGQEFLIKALPHIHSVNKSVHILIVGDETKGESRNYLQYLTKLVAELNLKEFVHFVPHMDDPLIAFGALDIFALTSGAETYGMVTLEAMASGLPIVATNSGGTPELLGNGDLGVLVPPQQELELAIAINQLLTDENLRNSIGRKAQKASRNYSYQRQCELVEKLIEELKSN